MSAFADMAVRAGLSAGLLLVGCGPGGRDTAVGAIPEPEIINLRWVQTGQQSWSEAESGLFWSLSALGARPQRRGVRVLQATEHSVEFELDLSLLGLNPTAYSALMEAVTPIHQSWEHRVLGSVDVGRFLQRTLYEPWVYYAVTGACGRVEDWSERLTSQSEMFAITESLLTSGDRRLRGEPEPESVFEIAWTAEEGTGQLADGSFEARATEVIDFMPSGRYRYAVYDETGVLVPGADPAHTPAGQPGRCLWCHEDHLMPSVVQPDLDGFQTYETFRDEVDTQQEMVRAYRATLSGPAIWLDPSVHTSGEILVEGFLRSSLARIAGDWSVPEEVIAGWLEAAGHTAETNDEYPEWGDVWRRADIDDVLGQRIVELAEMPASRFAGVATRDFSTLGVLSSSRETPVGEELVWLNQNEHACEPSP